MKLILQKSTIRPVGVDDAASIAEHINAKSVARNLLRVPHPYSLQDAERWIGSVVQQEPQTHFAIVVDGQAVGVIGLEPNPSGAAACAHSTEIGYWLGETYWGRGIVTEGLIAVTEWAFRELRLVRIYAPVFARNGASARVLEKAGYRLEGRLRAHYFRDGEYIDGLLYAKVRLRC
jgi:RimJ/RimL family protein N-acetyltransferase